MDRNTHAGVDRRVSVYDITVKPGNDVTAPTLIDFKDIIGRESGWETFTVSEALKK